MLLNISARGCQLKCPCLKVVLQSKPPAWDRGLGTVTMPLMSFQDSNADSNDGGDDADDADDEFECDCAMCHNIGGK